MKIYLRPALLALLLIGSAVAAAQESISVKVSFSPPPKEPIAINVLVGQSRLINFDRPIGRLSVSNPEIAEAVIITGTQALINGKAFGQINLIAWEKDNDNHSIAFDVYVRANLSLIDAQIRTLFPKDDIRLSQANGSVVLSGTVAVPFTAAQAEQVVQAAGFKTVNLLQGPIRDALQVQLQVRVAEVSRNRLRELGTSYAYQSQPGAGGYVSPGGPYSVGGVDGGNILGSVASSALNVLVLGGNTGAFVRALQSQGALRSLAEPTLIATDGQKASFLAGGEFPVPVISNGGGGGGQTVTITFKEYGVRLNFTPTIIDEDHIRLELEPEVSMIDFANGVRFAGFVVPGVRTRRAKTGIELRDGQSFALAGMLDNSETRSLSKIPVIGDVPILGRLFRSTSFQKQETELVFIVTAQMVKPINRDEIPNLRGIDGLKGAPPLGIEAPTAPSTRDEGISGPSGYSPGLGNNAAPASSPVNAGAHARSGAAPAANKPPDAPAAPAKINPAPTPKP
jgi:pilus assembly protein CpaC